MKKIKKINQAIKLLIKGIQRDEDAIKCMKLRDFIDCIIVSNHNYSRSSIEVLKECVK